MIISQSIHKKYLLLSHKHSLTNSGETYPNPSVGCLIVDFQNNKKGEIISFGSTGKSGRPHAEEVALKKIKKINNKVIMYLTLEPCYHKSNNISCVNQIINSGIKNVFISSEDPDNRTNNKSIKKLKKNNINVNIGLTKELTYLNNRFFYINKKNNRSYIKYKLATSKDFKIAKSNYTSKWISNKFSRNYSHKLRYMSDAILTTYNTIKYDNPKLTIRINKYPKFKNKIIILDSKLDIDVNSKILKSAFKRNIIIFTMIKNISKIKKLKKLNCNIFLVKNSEYFDIKFILKKTYKLGICNILVEAGGKLFTHMYDKKIIDELHLFISQKKIGPNGIPMYHSKKNFSLHKHNKSLITKKKFFKDLYYQFNF